MINNIYFLNDYTVPIIVGVCLCFGYILKNLVQTDKINRFIPLIMAAIGVVMAAWINKLLTPEILLSGLFSGLASTGLHEAFKNLINKESEDEK